MHMVATPNSKMQRVLQLSMLLTLAYVGATFYFGLRAHSLALISEAGHNVSDLLAIVLSFVSIFRRVRQPIRRPSATSGRESSLPSSMRQHLSFSRFGSPFPPSIALAYRLRCSQS